MTFKELGLIEPLLKAIEKQGYNEPSPIQQNAIPPLLTGRDLIGCAQTGTGKTAAFALPILQLMSQSSRRGIRALVVTPTRELALQIYENFESYGANTKLRSAVIFGGVGQAPQVEILNRGVDILVATPGRLNDLMNQGIISLKDIEIFVLDEADRMLDMGFIHDIKKLLRALPQKRQTLLFSATMPTEIEQLAGTILHDAVTVKVDPVTSTVDAIDQCIYFVDKLNKKLLLEKLLKTLPIKNVLVFTRAKYGADRVVKELSRVGITAMAIHGDKSQTARQTALSRFKSGELRVLIATDIAARGIDVPELSHVINYDLPNEPETYIHRIGRTGRAGMEGDAISFCCYDELEYLRSIEKLTGIKLTEKQSDYPMVILQKTEKVQQQRPPRDKTKTARHQQPAAPKSPKAHADQKPAHRGGAAKPKAYAPKNANGHRRPSTHTSAKRGG